MTFDPQKHLTTLKGKSYLEVKWRLLWLRTEHPDAVIVTELVEHDRERRWCMFKATVSIPGGGSATGYGQEDAAGFQGNPGDYPEKSETKALGRALSALGYGTQFTTDHDFDSGEGRVVDSPVARTIAAPAVTRPAPPNLAPVAPSGTDADMAASPDQLNALMALGKSQGRTPRAMGILAQERFGLPTASIATLRAWQAEALQRWLTEQEDVA